MTRSWAELQRNGESAALGRAASSLIHVQSGMTERSPEKSGTFWMVTHGVRDGLGGKMGDSIAQPPHPKQFAPWNGRHHWSALALAQQSWFPRIRSSSTDGVHMQTLFVGMMVETGTWMGRDGFGLGYSQVPCLRNLDDCLAADAGPQERWQEVRHCVRLCPCYYPCLYPAQKGRHHSIGIPRVVTGTGTSLQKGPYHSLHLHCWKQKSTSSGSGLIHVDDGPEQRATHAHLHSREPSPV